MRPEAHSPGRIEHTGKFIQEPIISINFNFPPKNVYISPFGDLWFESFPPNYLFQLRQQKTHPEKNWLEF